MAVSSSMDELFMQFNKYPLTVKAGTKISGKHLRGKNELPLMSQSVANVIASVIWGISSHRGQSNIQKTIEISVKRKFLPYMNAISRANRKSMHHLYEWNKVGQTSARLFDLVVPGTSRGKASFSMKVKFRPSKTLVPLTAAQSTPNEFTGEVVKKVHRFWNKAMVMEYGETITIRPKNSKYMAFDNPPGSRVTLSGLTFSSKPVVINYSQRPTFRGLDNAVQTFFSEQGQQEAKKSLSRYTNDLGRRASKTAHSINISRPSDAYAKAMAEKVANSMVPSG